MPKAWFCIPSARPVAEVLPIVHRWQRMGYGVALWVDDPFAPADGAAFALRETAIPNDFGCDVLFVCSQYPGYAQAVNAMAAHILKTHPEVDWIVTGGDDTFPDPNKTGDEIADECKLTFWIRVLDAFWEHGGKAVLGEMNHSARTFGVMQPTGDDWSDSQGRIIERIAGSPWLGREWCRRAHGGRGPLFPEFTHMFVDEGLQLYAQSLGVFLQRPDLTHFHAHAQRDGKSKAPAHMAQWNTQKHWVESKAIFERLKSTNFAECQPIP